jgi:hypothetical protein
VQFEFPWALGPADGRYVLRPHAGEDPSHVVVLATLGAPQRRFLRRRRTRSVAPQPGAVAVPVTRATVIDAAGLPTEAHGRRWLDGADGEAQAAQALSELNRVVRAHRMTIADAGARDATRSQALVIRVGWGLGEEVADGRHRVALELLAQPAAARTGELRAQERIAALLSGRDVVLAAEELALRARSDLEARRPREAALQLRIALEAALAELPPWQDRGDLGSRVRELADARGDVAAVANQALGSGLDPQEEATVERVLGRVEAALRARAASSSE